MALQHVQLSSRRRTELTRLPQEHQAFLTSDVRTVIQQVQSRGTVGSAKDVPASGRKYLESVIAYHCPSDNLILSTDITAKLCVLGLVHIYADPDIKGPDPDYNLLISALLTILASFASSNDILQAGLLRACGEYNIRLEPITYDTEAAITEAFNQVWPSVRDAMGITEFDISKSIIIIVALSMLLLISKRLVTHAIPRWFYNRWRSFAQVMAVKMNPETVNAPDLEACLALNTAISSKHQIRARIFTIYRRLASMQHGKYRNIFAVICKQLEFSEMSHIYLIMQYIYGQHSDVLGMTELMGAEQSAMSKALAKIATYPLEDRPYLKLLHPHEELEELHSKYFTKFTTAARAIAALYDSSMKNYQQRENTKLDEFARSVQRHITTKISVSRINAAESLHPMLNTKAASKMLERALEEDEVEAKFQDAPLEPRV